MQTKAIISLIVSLVLAIGAFVGVTIDEGLITTIVGGVVVAVVVIWDCWKNHNFTKAAQSGQQVLNAIKDGDLTADEVTAILAVTEQADGKGDV